MLKKLDLAIITSGSLEGLNINCFVDMDKNVIVWEIQKRDQLLEDIRLIMSDDAICMSFKHQNKREKACLQRWPCRNMRKQSFINPFSEVV